MPHEQTGFSNELILSRATSPIDTPTNMDFSKIVNIHRDTQVSGLFLAVLTDYGYLNMSNSHGCREYGVSHRDSHRYGYGVGMGKSCDQSPWACIGGGGGKFVLGQKSKKVGSFKA